MSGAEVTQPASGLAMLSAVGPERQAHAKQTAGRPNWLEHSFIGPLNAFCITLYNESRASFAATLHSLLTALRHFHAQDRYRSCFSTICIIADGWDEADPAIIELLAACRLTTHSRVNVGETAACLTLHGLDTLLSHLAGANRNGRLEGLEPLRMVVCLKRHNRGKLQSHSLFFDSLCRYFQPTFCFQIDCGTTVAPDSVLRLVARMERDTRIAALAPRVMPAIPDASEGILADWQYFDFALRKAVSWPFELATGHLSVVPGQACILRWRALQTAPDAALTPGSTAPLHGYLRGLEANAALERIMFLAEDRVIGNQIVLARDSRWHLGYAPDATAITDSCEHFAELFRQRRRWNNSAMVCRLWLLAQWPSVMGRSDRSRVAKLAFSTAVLAQLLLVIREFLLPAQLVAFLLVVTSGLGLFSHSAQLGLLTSLVGWVLLDLLGHRSPALRSRPAFKAGAIAAKLGTAGLFAVCVWADLPLEVSLILSAPILAMLAMLFVLPWRALLVLMPFSLFSLPNLVMSTSFSLYAIWNLHDVSWGTKGLRLSAAHRSAAARLLQLRDRTLLVWLGANAALSVAAIHWQGWPVAPLNPVVAVWFIADAVIAGLALGYLLQRRLRR